jgi:hypothetical protein
MDRMVTRRQTQDEQLPDSTTNKQSVAAGQHRKSRQGAKVRIPTKPAMHSNLKPATHSETKPATIPI